MATLLLGRIGSQVLLPALQPKTTPYTAGDFTYIGLLELNPVVCVVHPDSGYQTLGDLANAVKAKPGKLNYSHSGPATVQNLAPQLLLSTLGLKPDAVVSVPYKGQRGGAGGVEPGRGFRVQQPQFHDGPADRRQAAPAADDHARAAGAVSGHSHGARAGAAADGSGDRLERPVRAAEDGARGGAAMGGGAQADRAGSEVDRGNENFGGIPNVLSPEDTERYVRDGSTIYAELVAKAGLQVN